MEGHRISGPVVRRICIDRVDLLQLKIEGDGVQKWVVVSCLACWSRQSRSLFLSWRP